MRRPLGYYVTHVEGRRLPRVNGQPIGREPRLLKHGDIVEAGDERLEFTLDEQDQALTRRLVTGLALFIRGDGATTSVALSISFSACCTSTAHAPCSRGKLVAHRDDDAAKPLLVELRLLELGQEPHHFGGVRRHTLRPRSSSLSRAVWGPRPAEAKSNRIPQRRGDLPRPGCRRP